MLEGMKLLVLISDVWNAMFGHGRACNSPSIFTGVDLLVGLGVRANPTKIGQKIVCVCPFVFLHLSPSKTLPMLGTNRQKVLSYNPKVFVQQNTIFITVEKFSLKFLIHFNNNIKI